MSTSLQKLLAAEVHLAGGQFLLEEQTLNTESSLMMIITLLLLIYHY
jgi:hypothetical protein